MILSPQDKKVQDYYWKKKLPIFQTAPFNPQDLPIRNYQREKLTAPTELYKFAQAKLNSFKLFNDKVGNFCDQFSRLRQSYYQLTIEKQNLIIKSESHQEKLNNCIKQKEQLQRQIESVKKRIEQLQSSNKELSKINNFFQFDIKTVTENLTNLNKLFQEKKIRNYKMENFINIFQKEEKEILQTCTFLKEKINKIFLDHHKEIEKLNLDFENQKKQILKSQQRINQLINEKDNLKLYFELKLDEEKKNNQQLKQTICQDENKIRMLESSIENMTKQSSSTDHQIKQKILEINKIKKEFIQKENQYIRKIEDDKILIQDKIAKLNREKEAQKNSMDGLEKEKHNLLWKCQQNEIKNFNEIEILKNKYQNQIHKLQQIIQQQNQEKIQWEQISSNYNIASRNNKKKFKQKLEEKQKKIEAYQYKTKKLNDEIQQQKFVCLKKNEDIYRLKKDIKQLCNQKYLIQIENNQLKLKLQKAQKLQKGILTQIQNQKSLMTYLLNQYDDDKFQEELRKSLSNISQQKFYVYQNQSKKPDTISPQKQLFTIIIQEINQVNLDIKNLNKRYSSLEYQYINIKDGFKNSRFKQQALKNHKNQSINNQSGSSDKNIKISDRTKSKQSQDNLIQNVLKTNENINHKNSSYQIENYQDNKNAKNNLNENESQKKQYKSNDYIQLNKNRQRQIHDTQLIINKYFNKSFDNFSKNFNQFNTTETFKHPQNKELIQQQLDQIGEYFNTIKEKEKKNYRYQLLKEKLYQSSKQIINENTKIKNKDNNQTQKSNASQLQIIECKPFQT